MIFHRLFFVFSGALVLHFTQAQPTACTFSCPDTDVRGQALLKHVLAVPWKSDFSVFECVYGEVDINPKAHSCFYSKMDGKHKLSAGKDECPVEAIPCTGTANRFSSPGHPEVPAWIENGRYLLYLKENHT
ncbi:hypothetical protein AN958_09397 [Leucoagaricus sp. SymC.cos]|nr:hypothetical protein AN958_09397 [Leucoagaricus sp. SymC.cos]